MSQALSRRALLRSAAGFGGAAALAGGAALPGPAAAARRAPYLPYGRRSFFRRPVTGLVVDPVRTAEFRAFMKEHPEQREHSYPVINGLAGNEWGTTTHVSSASDPVWTMTDPREETLILGRRGFHMADDVALRIPTGTQDRPLLVIDPVFGYSMFAADVVPDFLTRTISVSSSAVFFHSSNGLDRRNPRCNDPRNFSSRGRIPDAKAIRPDLLRAGIANGTGLGHVLNMFFVETLSTEGFRHPMVGAEHDKHGWGAQGDRIAIRPGLHLRRDRGLTDAALCVARTLQTHGAYIGDNSGGETKLKGVQTTPTYHPYAGTNLSPDCLDALTWDDFVVLTRP